MAFDRSLTRLTPWLTLLVIVQIAVFLTRYESSIVGTLPTGQAQSLLLQRIYSLSNTGQTLGLLGSWRVGFESLDQLTVPTVLGSLLDLYAGGGRLALLLPNLVLFLALEVGIVAATLRLTRSRCSTLIGLGLFLLQSRPWSSQTGLLSVNPHWIAYCAFGVAAAALIAPPTRHRLGLVVLCASCAMIALTFSTPAFACLLIVFALRVGLCSRAESLRIAALSLSAFLAVAAMVILSVAPRCPPVTMTIVRLDQGTVGVCGYGLRTSLQYLLSFEFGLNFVLAGTLGLAAAAYLTIANRSGTARQDFRSVRKEAPFLIASLSALAIVQVLWRSANPIASGFVDVPALMVIIGVFDGLGRKAFSAMGRSATSCALLFVSVCIVLQWVSPASDMLIPSASIPPARADAVSWLMRDAEEKGRLNATILLAPHTIVLDAQSLSALFYETYGEIADFTVLAASDQKVNDAGAAIATFDYAVLPDTSGRGNSTSGKPDAGLLQTVEGSLIARSSVHSKGLDLAIYSVPYIQVVGISGDWLLSEGTSLRFDTSEIPADSVIQLRGPDSYARYRPEPPGVTATAETREGPVRLPARFERQGDSYAISVDPGPLNSAQTGLVDVQVKFSTFFVPSAIGMNPDPRKLTVLAPTSIGVAPRTAPP